jgi:hypothetical protein
MPQKIPKDWFELYVKFGPNVSSMRQKNLNRAQARIFDWTSIAKTKGQNVLRSYMQKHGLVFKC